MFERMLFAVVAAVTLGTLCGWLTGRADPASAAIAAVPGILTIVGTLLFWKSMGDNGVAAGGYAVVFVVAFSATFAMGVVHGARERSVAADVSVLNAMQRRIELAHRCSDAVIFLNQVRSRTGKPPLSLEDVCRLGQ